MSRQAIQTHYLAPTNFRGSRIVAKAAAGKVTIDFPYACEEPMREAAKALCAKLEWPTNMVEGELPNGDRVFVML